jgi:glycosyltransferase involved in cell wall biosynthesis
MTVNIGIVFASLGPYHLSRIEGCVNYFQKCKYQADVIAIELAQSQEIYPWQTKRDDYHFSIVSIIKNKALEKVNIFRLFLKINYIFTKINPDVVAISGYSEPGMLYILCWSIWHNKPIILFSPSKEDDKIRIWWQEKLKSLIIKRYKSALVGGKSHREYLIKLGLNSDAIFLGYNVVGNKNFHPANIRHLPCPINKSYFLAINRFISKKNLSLLISAYAQYRQESSNLLWDLVLSGDGELRPQIEQQINELGLTEFVHLPGFLQQEELLPYFAHANCFIHASIQEQWGLVVNEAMAAGLPVIVSNRCGCFEDLVIEGVNGFGFDPKNQQALTQLMLKMSSQEVDLVAMGGASLKHIQKYSPDYFAQGLMQAVEYSLAHS